MGLTQSRAATTCSTGPACPRCEKTLTPQASGSIQIDQCPSSFGTWLEGDGRRKAKDKRDASLERYDADLLREEGALSLRPSKLGCPACSKPMKPSQSNGP